MNLKSANTALFEAAKRLFGKDGERILNGADIEENAGEIKYFTRYVTGNGHIFIKDKKENPDFTNVLEQSTIKSEILGNVLASYTENDGVKLPLQVTQHMSGEIAKFFYVAWGMGEAGIFFDDPDTGLKSEDGAGVECDDDITALRFDAQEVKKIFSRLTVKGVKVMSYRKKEKAGYSWCNCLKFDVLHKKNEFEVTLLNCSDMYTEDQRDHAKNTVWAWAHPERVKNVA